MRSDDAIKERLDLARAVMDDMRMTRSETAYYRGFIDALEIGKEQLRGKDYLAGFADGTQWKNGRGKKEKTKAPLPALPSRSLQQTTIDSFRIFENPEGRTL
jgi:hypothetical protein